MERRGSECSACADSRTGLCGRCADRLDAQRTKAVASGQVLPRELQRKSHTQTNSIADDDRGSELKCSFCKARRRAREVVATELWICSQCDKRTDDKAIRDALEAEGMRPPAPAISICMRRLKEAGLAPGPITQTLIHCGVLPGVKQS